MLSPLKAPLDLGHQAPLLDANMYPHIVDEIFNQVHPSELLALRTVCRAWRQQADEVLASHILFFPGGVICGRVRGLYVRHPAFHPDAIPQPGPVPRPNTLPHAALTPATTPSSAIPQHLSKRSLPVKMLDWVGEAKQFSHISQVFDLKPQITRMWECDECLIDISSSPYWRSGTVVVFGWEPFCWESPYHWDYLAPFHNLAEGTRKLVINVSPLSQQYWTDKHEPLLLEDCQTLEEVVIIIQLPSTGQPLNALGARLIDGVIDIHCTCLRHTFVNAEALTASFHIPDSDWERCLHRFPGAWAQVKKAGDCFEDRARVLLDVLFTGKQQPQVEFLTQAEYEAKVGTETYRLETMEEPWKV